MKWSELIFKEIIAFRGYTRNKNCLDKKQVTPFQYILFNDGETFIELNEQDPYDYHDCSSSARELNLVKDKKRWQEIFGFKQPDNLGSDPF